MNGFVDNANDEVSLSTIRKSVVNIKLGDQTSNTKGTNKKSTRSKFLKDNNRKSPKTGVASIGF